MEGKLVRNLYRIDSELENLLVEALDEDFKSTSNEINYLLENIKRVSVAIKDQLSTGE